MITTAKRLDIVEEYYFSVLREVRQFFCCAPIINMGIEVLSPSPLVIDAITAAMHDDNAHQYQSYQVLPELRQGMADFMKIIMASH
jgi:aspartate/methionine/tyrosine aminotransferase